MEKWRKILLQTGVGVVFLGMKRNPGARLEEINSSDYIYIHRQEY